MRTLILKGILAIVLFTTLVLGGLCYLSGEWALRAGRLIYGATLTELTPQIDYLVKMMGSGLIALGLLNVLAFLNPVRYRHVIRVDAVMLVLRGLQRVLFAGTIIEAFAVPAWRLYVNAAIMLVAAILLLVLSPRGDQP